MHDLQLFDTKFMEISGGPVPLHLPSFSGVQNYKFNKLTIFFGVPHKFLGAPSACILHGMHPGQGGGGSSKNVRTPM